MTDWIQSELKRLENRLLKAKRQSLLVAENWREFIPPKPGVYILWNDKNGNPMYVGETANLHKRMSDLRRNVNHTFRRQVIKLWRATVTSDAEVSKMISKKCKLSFAVVEFGRKELEERLVGAWGDKYNLLNKPAKRAAIRIGV